jgi:phenylpropionate dioxygenase-like ring-hydroxylating dioxygenase large terminal subunit
MFIRNCWYVIAWDHEVPADGMLARTVLGEPLIAFRKSDGTVAVLADRCCHRLAPLSHGRKEGDAVRCGYHGMKFDATGQCIEVPGQERIPPKAQVRAYPTVTQHKWVFVWMGEPALADATLLPDNFSCDSPDWLYKPGYLHYDTPIDLICDNLLDFAHLSYVHEKTLGGSTKIAQSVPKIEEVPRGLRVTRHVPDVPPPPYYKRFREFAGNLDRWFIYDFVLPGTLLMHSGGRPTGQAEGDMRDAVQLHSCQTLTPETATTTHYFFQQAHRAGVGDATVKDAIFGGLLAAFEEDRAMITAQHRNIVTNPDTPMVPIASDAALVRFRKLVAQALADEAAATEPAKQAMNSSGMRVAA